ncbi:UNVERIFIED_CONTAM: hypothetical protein GTU68_040025 [Idotea baltica]|nr:hypothetical protein [Idotea baltica]
MIQGTGSNVGKSMLVAGLCRAARRRGLSVAPFKPQNMSNNAAVTVDGGEIGRAQAMQALACGLEPHTDMNPVLLKPETDVGAHVVVQGQHRTTVRARDYSALKPTLMQAVLESFGRLKQAHDLVIVEGAGSPAEVNLRAGDIANMGFAVAADVPVVLAGDIDRGGAPHEGVFHVVCLGLSRIANFDDLDPLAQEPGLTLTMLRAGQPIPGDADLVILPGSKSTRGDLSFLRAQGWDIDLAAHVRRGGHVLGICGGYQMLGQVVRDPLGIEGPAGETPGLGLLDVTTVMEPAKRLTRVQAEHMPSGQMFDGYEIHIGQTTGPDCARPFARINGDDEGAISGNGRIMGSYLHGLFRHDGFRTAFLANLGAQSDGLEYDTAVEATLDALADHIEAHLDLPGLLSVAR